MMHFADEPGTRRIFVNTMRGPLYSISYDGKTVTPNTSTSTRRTGASACRRRARNADSRASRSIRSSTRRGRQGTEALHLHRHHGHDAEAGLSDSGTNRTHDTVLLEWTAKDPAAATYDGGRAARAVPRGASVQNHNGGQIAFNPLAAPGSPDFGLMYVGSADGGSGGDPFNSRRTWRRSSARSCASIPSARTARTEVRDSGEQSVREEREAGHARRDLRAGRPESAALLVGLEDGPHVRGGYRAEHDRGNQPGDGRRQPRLEQMGRQHLYVAAASTRPTRAANQA